MKRVVGACIWERLDWLKFKMIINALKDKDVFYSDKRIYRVNSQSYFLQPLLHSIKELKCDSAIALSKDEWRKTQGKTDLWELHSVSCYSNSKKPTNCNGKYLSR